MAGTENNDATSSWVQNKSHSVLKSWTSTKGRIDDKPRQGVKGCAVKNANIWSSHGLWFGKLQTHQGAE